MLTATIDAKQGRDAMTADIPNAFVQTKIDNKELGYRNIMRIRGALVSKLWHSVRDGSSTAPSWLQGANNIAINTVAVQCSNRILISSRQISFTKTLVRIN